MSKRNNTGGNNTHGFGTVDQVVPDSTVVDPGARNLNDPDWVRRDRIFKELGTAHQKFS